MEIKNVEIKPIDDIPHHLKPTLRVEIEISDITYQETIFGAYGDLRIDNTILSQIKIEEYKNKSDVNKLPKSETIHSVVLRGYAELDKESLDFIKKSRYTAKNENVDFDISLGASVLEKSPQGNIISYYKYSPHPIPYTIPSSDWAHNYAPKLGMGEFLVLEIPLKFPDANNKLKKNAEKELQNVLTLISNAEKSFYNMVPLGVISNCRQAVESLSTFMVNKEFKNKDQLTDWQKDAMEKIIRLSGKYLGDLKHLNRSYNNKKSKENPKGIEENDKQNKDADSNDKVKSGYVGIFGFLSFMSHDQTQNKDDDVHSLIPLDGYDAEAALFFTKVFVKFVAEILYKEGQKDR